MWYLFVGVPGACVAAALVMVVLFVKRYADASDSESPEDMSEDERWGKVGKLNGTDWFKQTEL